MKSAIKRLKQKLPKRNTGGLFRKKKKLPGGLRPRKTSIAVLGDLRKRWSVDDPEFLHRNYLATNVLRGHKFKVDFSKVGGADRFDQVNEALRGAGEATLSLSLGFQRFDELDGFLKAIGEWERLGPGFNKLKIRLASFIWIDKALLKELLDDLGVPSPVILLKVNLCTEALQPCFSRMDVHAHIDFHKNSRASEISMQMPRLDSIANEKDFSEAGMWSVASEAEFDAMLHSNDAMVAATAAAAAAVANPPPAPPRIIAE